MKCSYKERTSRSGMSIGFYYIRDGERFRFQKTHFSTYTRRRNDLYSVSLDGSERLYSRRWFEGFLPDSSLQGYLV